MSRQLRRLGPDTWLLCGFLAWLLAVAVIRAAPGPAAPAATTGEILPPVVGDISQDAAQTPAEYAGEDICLFCHELEGDGYLNSAHHFVSDPRTPAAANSCETCHGPGAAHFDADDPATVPMFNPAKAPADEVNALCLGCHDTGEHALWQGSQHEARGLSCVDCHSQHRNNTDTMLLKGETQMATCATCHRDKVAKMARAAHMPVLEGEMECTSCHNAHGSTNVRLLRVGDSIAESCTSCHADKRGPYLWEHPSTRDGCVTCHDPHGSSNERLLVTRTPMLCQRCHVASRHPADIYDEAEFGATLNANRRVFGRSCVTCHSNIHGSNHPGGQRFTR